ncbi:MAG: Cna B-type domain-containing protein, partial [Lachnospiraceae bacterium]|nr:Cna B-type domain-containing protein [Lachnospiraceae bacterium]
NAPLTAPLTAPPAGPTVALTVEHLWPEDNTTRLIPGKESITLELVEKTNGTETKRYGFVVSPDGTIQQSTALPGKLTQTKEVRDAQGNVVAWIFDVTELPQKNAKGEPLSYELFEVVTNPNEKVGTDVNSGSGTTYNYSVTDRVTKTAPPPDEVRLDVEKIWLDQNGNATAGNRPPTANVQSVQVWLTRDGVRTGDSVTLDAANGWKAYFDKLPDSYIDTNTNTKQYYEYSVAEDRLPGYEAPQVSAPAQAANGKDWVATVTNRERGETREIIVRKKFTGGTEAELAKAKATEIVFTLRIGNDVVYESDGLTPKRVVRPANAPDDWEGKFTGLPVYVSGTDTRIDYNIVETTQVEGYTSSYELSNGGAVVTFTNARKREAETTSVAVRKVFKDAAGKTVKAPEEVDAVTVYLTENGTRSSKAIKLHEGNNFSGRFDDLPRKDSTGKDITYGVQEGWVLDKNGKNLNDKFTATVTAVTGADKKTNAALEFEISNRTKPKEEEEEEERLVKTVNGEREYKLKEEDETIVYEIRGIVPEHAVRMEIRDQMPDVLVTRVVKVFIDGKELREKVSVTVKNNLVTVYFDSAKELVGKEMLVRIEAHFMDGADVTGYANYYVDNTAEWYVNGDVYGQSRAASIDSEVLVIRHHTQNARRSQTGDTTDTMVFQLRMMMAAMAVVFLATLNPRGRKKRAE